MENIVLEGKKLLHLADLSFLLKFSIQHLDKFLKKAFAAALLHHKKKRTEYTK